MAASAPPQMSNFEAPPPYPGLQKQPPAGYAYPPPPQVGQPPQMANYPPPPTGQVTSTNTTTMFVVPGAAQPPQTAVIFIPTNGCMCPRCRVGHLCEESNAFAICCIVVWAILFFPIGLLYLLCLPSEKTLRCSNCGYQARH